MRKSFALLATISLFLLFVFPTSVFATTPENIEIGDLFIYTVNKWDVPYEALIPPEEQPPFNLSDLVLDLSGSTLGIKVMDTYSNGYYLLDLYVISGKAVSIPLPPQEAPLAGEAPTPAEVYQIFGDSIDIPAGVGFSIGSIPGSDFLEALAGTEEDPGVPFYLNPDEWEKYEAEIGAAIEEEAPAGTVSITNEEGSDFEVELKGSEEGITVDLTLKWFREGDNAGVFKSISGTMDGDINNDTIVDHLEVALEYESKDNNPLPEFIQDRDELILTMTKADFEFAREGTIFDDPTISEQLLMIEDMILDLEDREVMKYDIKSVRGCYYQTAMSQYDASTGALSPTGDTWWNGFTGFQTVQKTESFGYIYNGTTGIIPTGAPGMTPDWDMWRASTKTVQEFLKVLEKQVEVWSGTTNFTNLGLSLDEFDTNYEMRYSRDTVFFYGNITLDAGFNYADVPAGYVPPNNSILYILGPYLKNSTAIDIQAFGKIWISYTQKEGILAGAGALVNASLDVTDIPIIIPGSQGPPTYANGTLDISADLEVQSDKFTKDLDPEEAGTEPVEGDGLFTPGFTIIPALMVIAVVVVFIKRRR